MRKSSILFLLLTTILFASKLGAQDINLPKDDNGKFTVYDIVELPGTKKEFLYKNALSFAKKIKVFHKKASFLTADPDSGKITTKGSFLVSPIGSIGKSIAGAMEYTLILQVKDGKYRYTITDFTFNDYERNRYGRFEPVTGKYTPLEVEPSKINHKQWEHNCDETLEKAEALVEQLSEAMLDRGAEKDKKKARQEKLW